jgi:hypothetical protein
MKRGNFKDGNVIVVLTDDDEKLYLNFKTPDLQFSSSELESDMPAEGCDCIFTEGESEECRDCVFEHKRDFIDCLQNVSSCIKNNIYLRKETYEIKDGRLIFKSESGGWSGLESTSMIFKLSKEESLSVSVCLNLIVNHINKEIE